MAREREKEFASLTSGSRAHDVWQAITPWGEPQGVSLFRPTDSYQADSYSPLRRLGVLAPPWHGVLVHFYDLVPPCPDTDISHRGSREILKPVHVRPGRRRQLRQPSGLGQLFPPPGKRLVNRLNPLDRFDVGRHTVHVLAIEPVSYAHRYLSKRVEHVELRHRQPRQAIHANGIPDNDRIEPSTPSRPPRRRPKFASDRKS